MLISNMTMAGKIIAMAKINMVTLVLMCVLLIYTLSCLLSDRRSVNKSIRTYYTIVIFFKLHVYDIFQLM